MMERVQSILEIASHEGGPWKRADEVEAMLIEEMRRLGHSTMSQWATSAEERVSTGLQNQEPTVLRRKKTLKWWCVFGLIEVRERIWYSPTQSYLRPLPGRLGVTPRGRSRRLERVLNDFGCEHSFARSAESVREHYGIEVSVSSMRAPTLKHAQRAHRQMQEQSPESFQV